MTGPRAVLLTGTVGVGKTTVLDHLGDLWREEGRPHALVDLDELRRTWPPPPQDRFQADLTLRNLAALRANDPDRATRAVGLAGVVEDGAERDRLQAAVGAELAVVRLVAAPGTVDARLRARHGDDGERLAWHLRRRAELDGVLDAARPHDHEVDVDDVSPRQAARRVLDLLPGR